MITEERRSEERVVFKVSATVEAAGEQIVSNLTEDLSVRGVLVRSEKILPVGTSCRITLELSGTSSKLHLRLKGHVARVVSDQGFALEFEPMDLDSHIYLKNIVGYNRTPDGDDEKSNPIILE